VVGLIIFVAGSVIVLIIQRCASKPNDLAATLQYGDWDFPPTFAEELSAFGGDLGILLLNWTG